MVKISKLEILWYSSLRFAGNIFELTSVVSILKKMRIYKNFFEYEFYLSEREIEQEICIKYELVFSNDNNWQTTFSLEGTDK